MPQFDLYCFCTQVFWTCVLFLSFYAIMLKFYLPKFALALKLREKRKSLLKASNSLKASKPCLYSSYIACIFRDTKSK